MAIAPLSACEFGVKFGPCGDGCARCRRGARGKVVIDLVADCLQLTRLELGDLDPAPALGGANECRIHELGTARSPKACGMTLVRRRSGLAGLLTGASVLIGIAPGALVAALSRARMVTQF